MKTSNKILIAGLVILMVISLAAQFYLKSYLNKHTNSTFNRSGISISKDISIGAFNGVGMNIDADLKIHSGPQAIKLTGDSSYLSHIRFEVKDSSLSIFTDDNFQGSFDDEVKIDITLPNLQSLNLLGSGNMDMVDSFQCNNADIILSGSGNMNAKFWSQQMKIELVGSGNMSNTGSADKLDVALSGSGEVDCKRTKSREAKLEITGSGDISVNVSDVLQTVINGSGDIHYVGQPKLKSSTTGSGSVEPIEK